jgi:hypothetical protein
MKEGYYRAELRVISGTRGHFVVGLGAYTLAERFFCRASNRYYDFRDKPGVVASGVVSIRDITPEALLNEVERSEIGKPHAVLGREWIVGLSYELSRQAMEEALRRLARDIGRKFGVAVIWALHAPDVEGGTDERGWHGHLIITDRSMTLIGLAEMALAFHDRWTKRKDTEWVRERWAKILNEALAREGIAVRVDHRSYKRRQLDRLPRVPLGRKFTRQERAMRRAEAEISDDVVIGAYTRRGRYHEAVARYNAIAALYGPGHGLTRPNVLRDRTTEDAVVEKQALELVAMRLQRDVKRNPADLILVEQLEAARRLLDEVRAEVGLANRARVRAERERRERERARRRGRGR